MEKQHKFEDADTINIENDYELEYWTAQLKVTNDELKNAVIKAGNNIEAVKVFLNKA